MIAARKSLNPAWKNFVRFYCDECNGNELLVIFAQLPMHFLAQFLCCLVCLNCKQGSNCTIK